MARGRNRQRPREVTEEVTLQGIAEKLSRLRWKHSLWGVSERQAWHVVQRMDEMYRQLLREQEVRYEALLAQARREGGAAPANLAPGASSPRQVQTLQPLQPGQLGKPGQAAGAASMASQAQAAPRAQAAQAPAGARMRTGGPDDTQPMPVLPVCPQAWEPQPAQAPQASQQAPMAGWDMPPQDARGQRMRRPRGRG